MTHTNEEPPPCVQFNELYYVLGFNVLCTIIYFSFQWYTYINKKTKFDKRSQTDSSLMTTTVIIHPDLDLAIGGS